MSINIIFDSVAALKTTAQPNFNVHVIKHYWMLTLYYFYIFIFPCIENILTSDPKAELLYKWSPSKIPPSFVLKYTPADFRKVHLKHHVSLVCAPASLMASSARGSQNERISHLLPVASGTGWTLWPGVGPRCLQEAHHQPTTSCPGGSRLGLCTSLFPFGGDVGVTFGPSLEGDGGLFRCECVPTAFLKRGRESVEAPAALSCNAGVHVRANALISTVTLWRSGLHCHKPTLHKEQSSRQGQNVPNPPPTQTSLFFYICVCVCVFCFFISSGGSMRLYGSTMLPYEKKENRAQCHVIMWNYHALLQCENYHKIMWKLWVSLTLQCHTDPCFFLSSMAAVGPHFSEGKMKKIK